MRVIEPSNFRHNKPSKTRKSRKQGVKRSWTALFALFAISFFLIFTVRSSVSNVDNNETAQLQDNQIVAQADVTPTGEIKTLEDFSGDELRLFYDNLVQTGTERVATPAYITGNDVADTIIRSEAELRGYKLRSFASVDLTLVDGMEVQQPVAGNWTAFKSEMATKGLNIQMTSGYRSIDNQRDLFLQRMREAGLSEQEVIDGTDQEALDEVLTRAAPPGYSKHHTGYTIDIWCIGWDFYNFGESDCFDEISKDNYALAKKHGFIPSYPDTATLQGPSPEAWEYLWVGDVL